MEAIASYNIIMFPHFMYAHDTAGIIVVGFFDNSGLFCKSRDWLVSIGRGRETLFCTISGICYQLWEYPVLMIFMFLVTYFHRKLQFLNAPHVPQICGHVVHLKLEQFHPQSVHVSHA